MYCKIAATSAKAKAASLPITVPVPGDTVQSVPHPRPAPSHALQLGSRPARVHERGAAACAPHIQTPARAPRHAARRHGREQKPRIRRSDESEVRGVRARGRQRQRGDERRTRRAEKQEHLLLRLDPAERELFLAHGDRLRPVRRVLHHRDVGGRVMQHEHATSKPATAELYTGTEDRYRVCTCSRLPLVL
jgi:hypothetical protein